VLFDSAAVVGRRLRPSTQLRLLLVFVALAGFASLVWSVYRTASLPPVAYFSPVTRAWELALGGGLAVAATTLARVHRGWKVAAGWAGLLAIAASAVTFSSETPFQGYSALLPTIGAALVIFAGMTEAHSRGAVARLLDRAPMRYVGDRSYAFYLWHWPVLILAQQYLEYEPPVAVNLALLLGAFGLSIASYALVENPMRRMTWTPARTGVAFGMASVAVIATTTLSIGVLQAREQRFRLAAAPEPPFPVAQPIANRTPRHRARPSAEGARALPAVVAAVEAARRGARIPSRLTPPIGELVNERLPYSLPPGCVPVARSNETSSKICPLGRTGSSRSIVVIGDSHAQMWLPAVLSVARHDAWVVLPILRPGCLPGQWLATSVCNAWYR
jgi:Acyltransferase family/SGNH domain (fused to AT3 domains)